MHLTFPKNEEASNWTDPLRTNEKQSSSLPAFGMRFLYITSRLSDELPRAVCPGMTPASPVATTMASDNRESYPAQSFSLVQLLSATKSKLEDALLGGRYAQGPILQRATHS